MPYIKQTTIDAVQDRADIVDIVGTYVDLKRAGHEFKGLSPFNQEKTPSFYVNPAKNSFYCFSSGQGGNILQFVMEMENLTYPEAIEYIANKYAIPVEYEATSAQAGEAMSLKKQLLSVHEHAAYWFHQNFLAETQDGQFIRNYWTDQRKFTIELAKECQIGFAPAAPTTTLGDYLKEKGHSPEALRESGLFYFERNGQWISRFQGRLMIPIHDIQGRPIAFTARQTEMTPESDTAKDAKYVNSPETPLFHKGKVLFGLDHARQHTRNHDESFLLVEGQLDVLRCREQGLNHAVAPQGTALTEEQLLLLKRYSPKALHCFLDGDAAGQKAAYRSIPLCFRTGLNLYFLPLPQGSDPDDYLQQFGKAGFDQFLKSKLPAIQFATQFLRPPEGFTSPEQRVQTLNELFSLIRESGSLTAQDGYIQEISRHLRADEAAIRTDYSAYQRKQKNPDNPSTSSQIQGSPILTNANLDILSLILLHPTHSENIAHQLDPEWVDRQTPHATLLLKILMEIREGVWTPEEELPESLLEDDQERNLFYQITNTRTALEQYQDPEAKINECLHAFKRQHLQKKKAHIEQSILAAQSPPENWEELKALQKEKNEIRKLLQNLKKPSQTQATQAT